MESLIILGQNDKVAFEAGVEVGAREMAKTYRDEGRNNTCAAIIGLYGPRGVNMKDVWIVD